MSGMLCVLRQSLASVRNEGQKNPNAAASDSSALLCKGKMKKKKKDNSKRRNTSLIPSEGPQNVMSYRILRVEKMCNSGMLVMNFVFALLCVM
jgi:hypothetical protein